jgi:hypothetical protein
MEGDLKKKREELRILEELNEKAIKETALKQTVEFFENAETKACIEDVTEFFKTHVESLDVISMESYQYTVGNKLESGSANAGILFTMKIKDTDWSIVFRFDGNYPGSNMVCKLQIESIDSRTRIPIEHSTFFSTIMKSKYECVGLLPIFTGMLETFVMHYIKSVSSKKLKPINRKQFRAVWASRYMKF